MAPRHAAQVARLPQLTGDGVTEAEAVPVTEADAVPVAVAVGDSPAGAQPVAHWFDCVTAAKWRPQPLLTSRLLPPSSPDSWRRRCVKHTLASQSKAQLQLTNKTTVESRHVSSLVENQVSGV